MTNRLSLQIANSPPWAKKMLLLGCAILSLVGCETAHHEKSNKEPVQAYQPERQLSDYLLTACPAIWQIVDSQAMANPLFWLRTLECADRLSAHESTHLMNQLAAASGWHNAFKRAILLSATKPSAPERRRYLISLDTLADDIALPVRPLFIVWRDGQRASLNLGAERAAAEKREASLQAEIAELSEQLAVTSRKLENLTDIERQLSARKPRGHLSADASHASLEDALPVEPEKD